MKQRILTLALLGTFALLITGCNEQSTERQHLLEHLTPNMRGLAQTFDEHDAGLAVTNNVNSREYEDDWRRFWLLDRPSSLSPFPVVRD